MNRIPFLVAAFTFFYANVFGQDSLKVILKQSASLVEPDTRLLYFYDGVPIMEGDSVFNHVDPKTIESITLHRKQIINCSSEPLYDALFKVSSKDSINTTLKYLLSQTQNWIFTNPFADLRLNGDKVAWSESFERLSGIDSTLIQSVQIIAADYTSDCDYGYISIKTQK